MCKVHGVRVRIKSTHAPMQIDSVLPPCRLRQQRGTHTPQMSKIRSMMAIDQGTDEGIDGDDEGSGEDGEDPPAEQDP